MPDDVKNWLERLGLGQYASLFAENDIDLDVVLELTDQDLKDLFLYLGTVPAVRNKVPTPIEPAE